MVNISETVEELSKLLDEIFPEAIRRIPIHPDYADITFLAHGISIPDSKSKEGDHSVYSKKCRENGVLPYSSIDFEFSGDKGKFVPTLTQISIPVKSSQVTLDNMANPGKINKFRFNIGKYFGAEEFKLFLVNHLDELLIKSYKPAMGSLRFYEDSDRLLRPSAEISFGINIPGDFKLDVKDERYRERFDKLFSVVMTNGQQLKLF